MFNNQLQIMHETFMGVSLSVVASGRLLIHIGRKRTQPCIPISSLVEYSYLENHEKWRWCFMPSIEIHLHMNDIIEWMYNTKFNFEKMFHPWSQCKPKCSSNGMQKSQNAFISPLQLNKVSQHIEINSKIHWPFKLTYQSLESTQLSKRRWLFFFEWS